MPGVKWCMYRDRKEQYDHTISIMMHEASDNSMNSKAIKCLLEEPKIKTEGRGQYGF